MKVLQRLSTALYAAAATLLPVAALAQGIGGSDPVPSSSRNYGWLWMLAAAIVVFALFRMFFGRSGRTTPPARRP